MLGFYNVMNNEDYYKANKYIRISFKVLFVIWFTLFVALLIAK